MQKLDPKLRALGLAPGQYDEQRDAVRLARRLKRDLGTIDAGLRCLDPRSPSDARKLRSRLEQLQMAAIELLGLGFASDRQGKGRLRGAVAVAFMNIVHDTVRRCSRMKPPERASRPTFLRDYPRALVRAVDLQLASLEEVVPDLARRLARPPRASRMPLPMVDKSASRRPPPMPAPVQIQATRRDAVLQALCEAVAIKIRSGTKAGSYLHSVADAVADADFTVPSTSELRGLGIRIG